MTSSYSKTSLLRPSTSKQKAVVLENLRSGECFWKETFSVTVFTGYVWTVDQIGEKKSVFKQKRILVDVASVHGRFPFNPKFRKFRLVHQIERTISVWSDRNIRDQPWRWSTLTGLVISVGRTEMSLPFNKIVVHSTALLHPAYKNNNQTRGGLGRVCATGMYRSIEHVKFLKFQTGIFVEWKAPHVSLLCTSATRASVLTKLPHSGLFLDIFSGKVSWRYPRIREQTWLKKRLNSATATCQLLSSIRQLWVHVFRAHRNENKFKNIMYWNFGIKK